MKAMPMTKILALSMALAWAPASLAADLAGDMPDIEKIRFCKRLGEHAVQALYSRDRGAPMPLYAEDAGNGPRIINAIVRRIYGDPAIVAPQEAAAVSRATCHDMMGVRDAPQDAD